MNLDSLRASLALIAEGHMMDPQRQQACAKALLIAIKRLDFAGKSACNCVQCEEDRAALKSITDLFP